MLEVEVETTGLLEVEVDTVLHADQVTGSVLEDLLEVLEAELELELVHADQV